MPTKPEHIFVLMLENRSFDHLFGLSGLTGVDAVTGALREIDGLTGDESNSLNGKTYTVTTGADYATHADPGHEFSNVLDQLCGPGVGYVAPYPPINLSGFVHSANQSVGSASAAEVMKSFDTPNKLPVLFALAREFALCDRWFSSLPGPTWPNRMFVHAASSGGLDHSPTIEEIILWETISGFYLEKGTVFDALHRHKKKTYRLYSGDQFPMVAALKGISLFDVHRIDDLVQDLKKDSFPYNYVFIEPSYNVFQNYRDSTSHHPLADVRHGEALVKTVYEALRASPIWEDSLFIVTWDEHGGFYDHVVPETAIPPGDKPRHPKHNRSGFTFSQYGVRTAAIVVSPFIPQNTVDGRVYDHASIPKTLADTFTLTTRTARDAGARSLLPLLSLPRARQTIATLPTPASPPALGTQPLPTDRPNGSINDGNVPLVVHSALRQDLELDPAKKSAILARVARLQTRDDAMRYVAIVARKLRAIQKTSAKKASRESGAAKATTAKKKNSARKAKTPAPRSR